MMMLSLRQRILHCKMALRSRKKKTVHINMRILIRQKSLKDVRQMVSYMVIDMSLQVKYP